jgi:hypothetical protein
MGEYLDFDRDSEELDFPPKDGELLVCNFYHRIIQDDGVLGWGLDRKQLCFFDEVREVGKPWRKEILVETNGSYEISTNSVWHYDEIITDGARVDWRDTIRVEYVKLTEYQLSRFFQSLSNYFSEQAKGSELLSDRSDLDELLAKKPWKNQARENFGRWFNRVMDLEGLLSLEVLRLSNFYKRFVNRI